MKFFRSGWVIAVAAVLLLAAAGAIIYYYFWPFEARREVYRQKPEAPPDLAKLQPKFSAALDALKRGDAGSAARGLISFNCGGRMVDEYRLRYLGQASQAAGDARSARVTFASLWSRTPKMV